MYRPAEYFLPFRSSQVHYCCWGAGPKLVFAFHGYGESAASLGFLGTSLGADYTLVAIDLPFHGKTDWKEGLFIEPQHLYGFMQEIAAGRTGVAAANTAVAGRNAPFGWTLIGYSMGGRVALQLLQDHPEAIGRLILLAPDGLKVNAWYWLATRTLLGNLLFRWTMRWPAWFFLLLRLSHAFRLVNRSVYKFAVHYIHENRVRQDLYIRWTAMRGFRPRLADVATIIRQRQLPVRLVYGRYDRIIRWERGEKFRGRGIAPTCRIFFLETGHQLLRPQYLDLFLSLFAVAP